LIRELKKFKPLFIEALKSGKLEIIEDTLEKAAHLKFEIKEHQMLKKL